MTALSPLANLPAGECLTAELLQRIVAEPDSLQAQFQVCADTTVSGPSSVMWFGSFAVQVCAQAVNAAMLDSFELERLAQSMLQGPAQEGETFVGCVPAASCGAPPICGGERGSSSSSTIAMGGLLDVANPMLSCDSPRAYAPMNVSVGTHPSEGKVVRPMQIMRSLPPGGL